jgi:hypothetical protein
MVGLMFKNLFPQLRKVAQQRKAVFKETLIKEV